MNLASTGVTINGAEIIAKREKTVLGVCREAGVSIPTLCHDEGLESYGGCRFCLVEIKGIARSEGKSLRNLATAISL